MEVSERDLTAFCGLYCGDCIRYQSRASDLAGELHGESIRLHLAEYAQVKQRHTEAFKNFESFMDLLAAISEFRCDIPCRLGGDGCGGGCDIIACVKAQSFEGCWECHGFATCDKLDFLKPFHGDAPVNNLRKIETYGISNWARHRDKCYPWV